jgi:ribosomal protein S27E
MLANRLFTDHGKLASNLYGIVVAYTDSQGSIMCHECATESLTFDDPRFVACDYTLLDGADSVACEDCGKVVTGNGA